MLVAGDKRSKDVARGAERGTIVSSAAAFARELANTPPTYLNAKDLAAKAVDIGSAAGLHVEVFNKDQLEQMGCGGLLGVNRGSTEPPRMVKLTWSPRNATGHLALVGKGIMYDSGGISLKGQRRVPPEHEDGHVGRRRGARHDEHAARHSRCRTKVTACLMCTDNMPSGSALKLGDVLTMRNGKTVEIHNTDAEGRLVLADGLSLAVEDDTRCDRRHRHAHRRRAGGARHRRSRRLLGTNQSLVDQLMACSEATDEPLWQLPLAAKRYRKLLDSVVADMKNIGGPYGGAITASIFLSEFVGDIPWAHLDIAGPMMVDGDDGIYAKGATGFGTRVLIDLASATSPRRPEVLAEVLAEPCRVVGHLGRHGRGHTERHEMMLDLRSGRRRGRASSSPGDALG